MTATAPGATPIAFTADEHPHTRNRALDGVRAFAVAAVLAFHGGVNHFHGGFLGVDVFFVLSGFLITSLLVDEFHRRTTIDLGRFYLRRAKRLLPALLVVVVAVALGSWLLSPAGLYPHLQSDVVAAVFYFSNWHLMTGSNNYFTLLYPPSPLTHTWSLAIEEQFYIAWPLVVLLVLKLRRNVLALGVLAAVGAVLSSVVMAYGRHARWPIDRLYYGTDTHAQGLLLGAATACALVWWRRRSETRGGDFGAAGRLVGPVAIVGLLVLMERAHGTSRWMFQGGFFAVAACASVAIACLVMRPDSLVARTLSVGPLVYLGQISYGIYLWHYPIFHWLTNYQTGLGVWPLLLVRVALSVVAAAVSFHFLEMPIRRGQWPRSLRGASVALAAVAGVLALSLTWGSWANDVPVPRVPAPLSSGTPVRVLFLGDSLMWTLDYAVNAWGPHYGVLGQNGALIGCGLAPSNKERVHQLVLARPFACALRRDGTFPAPQLWHSAVASFRPNVIVVLAGRWETGDLRFGHQWQNIYSASFRRRITRSLGYMAADAASAHAALVFMTAPCSWDGEMANGQQWPENSVARLRRYNQLVRRDAQKFHAALFDLNRLVCPSGHVLFSQGGHVVRSADGIHFTLDAAPFLAPRLFPFLEKLGRTSLHR